MAGNLKEQAHLKLLELGLSLIFFHMLGIWHLETDMLKSLVTEQVMLVAVDFNILADISSGPLALLVSKDDRRSGA